MVGWQQGGDALRGLTRSKCQVAVLEQGPDEKSNRLPILEGDVSLNSLMLKDGQLILVKT